MALKKIEACVEEIRIWMIQHRLMMNDNNTKFIVIISIGNSNKVSVDSITIVESNVPPAPSARYIGVIFDQSFSFNDHISKLCQSGYFWLRNIRRVRRCLTLTATQLLVQALVLSRLDYCNSLLLGLPQGQISRLQRVQNSAARLVTCTPWREHISPVIMQLHWLPIAQRMEYKTLTLAFQAVYCTAPSYLCTLVDRYR